MSRSGRAVMQAGFKQHTDAQASVYITHDSLISTLSEVIQTTKHSAINTDLLSNTFSDEPFRGRYMN